MILILSERSDMSTNNVCDWLHSMSKKYLRINKEDSIKIVKFIENKNNTDFSFEYETQKYNLNHFSSVWFRRGHFLFEYFSLKELEVKHTEITSQVENHVLLENKFFLDYIYYKILKKKKTLGDIFKYDVNKLKTMYLAAEHGLKTPNYIVTTQKSELKSFLNDYSRILVKAIYENFSFVGKDFSLYHLNKEFDVESLSDLPDNFQTTLFQEYCEKMFEIRVFYLDKKTYSMAIMSQSNSKTKDDYRNYDNNKPTRCLPFNLPSDIKEGVVKLMTDLELNTGSIDFIYSNKGEYIFLEVNPVGQFGIVSKSLGANIEKDIANFLDYEV